MTRVVGVREATDADWPQVYRFFTAIVDEGHSYAFPEGLSIEETRPWWMEQLPGRTVVACMDGVVVGSA